MSYKSPIEIWYDDNISEIASQITKHSEMQIMAQNNQYVSVDKEELIKALNYDRQQYEKGYADAKAEYQRPQGEWVKIGEIGLAYKCNKCEVPDIIPSNFCPNCGAKMEKETQIRNTGGKS